MFDGPERRTITARVPGLRQQFGKGDGRPNLALADFVAERVKLYAPEISEVVAE